MTTSRDYMNRIEHFRTIDRGVRNIAAALHDVAEHLEKRPMETCFGNLPEIGDARLFAGCKSFDAEKFPTPLQIQEALDIRLKAVKDCWAAWHQLDERARHGLPTPPNWGATS